MSAKELLESERSRYAIQADGGALPVGARPKGKKKEEKEAHAVMPLVNLRRVLTAGSE